MKPNPEYEKKYTELLKEIILKECCSENCGVFLFGSRASGKARFGSDYDVGIMNIAEQEFDRLKSDILGKVDDSLIPWKVDIINFDTVSEQFKEIALRHITWWKTISPYG